MSTATEPEFIVNKSGVALTWQGQRIVVEPIDLRDGGWTPEGECDRDHCDDGNCPECTDEHVEEHGDPAEVLKRWHDGESGHSGPFKFCDHEPCKGLGQIYGVRFG